MTTRLDRLKRRHEAGNHWWLANYPMAIQRVVREARLGNHKLDLTDLECAPDDVWRNRHDARRWVRAFRGALTVAHDALLERRRVSAIVALLEVVTLEYAIRLTRSRERVNLTNEGISERRTRDARKRIVEIDSQLDDLISGTSYTFDTMVDIIADRYRVRLGLRPWNEWAKYSRQQELFGLAETHSYSQLVGRRSGRSTRAMILALATAEVVGCRRVFVGGRGHIAQWSRHQLMDLANWLELDHEIRMLPPGNGLPDYVLYKDHAVSE